MRYLEGEESVMSEIVFKSKWFEKCIRDYLGISDGPITEEDLSGIKYFTVETTHSHAVSFGNDELPDAFDFDDAGDEWNCCCITNTGKYSSIDEFIDINEWGKFKKLRIKDEVLEAEEELEELEEDEVEEKKTAKEIYAEIKAERAAMKEFMNNVKEYWPQSEDYEEAEEDEEACNSGLIFPEDFAYFKNVKVLRLKTCEWDVHTLAFLKGLPNLKILEVGEVRLSDLEGIEKLIGLDMLTIWSN